MRERMFIGRCKTCKHAIRVGSAAHCKMEKHRDGSRWIVCPRCSTLHVGAVDRGVITKYLVQQSVISFKEIFGVLNPDHKCDPRCTNATGHNCECSCGGVNHGAAYAS